MKPSFTPVYSTILDAQFEDRIQRSKEMLTCCTSCGWLCKVDRTRGTNGVCLTSDRAKISSYGPHMGEERPLSGSRGSGTIFFTRCNLRCQYCQNHDISQTDSGNDMNPEDIAEIMLNLQAHGCHN